MRIRVTFDYETGESLSHETEAWEKFTMDKFETIITNRPAPEMKVESVPQTEHGITVTEKPSFEHHVMFNEWGTPHPVIPKGGSKVTEKSTIEPYASLAVPNASWNSDSEKNPCEDIPKQLNWTQRQWTEFYKFLLLKYITKVGQDEGFTFITGERPKYFTEYEWETLKHFDEYSYYYMDQIMREVGT
jgi:hypothetical protein